MTAEEKVRQAGRLAYCEFGPLSGVAVWCPGTETIVEVGGDATVSWRDPMTLLGPHWNHFPACDCEFCGGEG